MNMKEPLKLQSRRIRSLRCCPGHTRTSRLPHQDGPYKAEYNTEETLTILEGDYIQLWDPNPWTEELKIEEGDYEILDKSFSYQFNNFSYLIESDDEYDSEVSFYQSELDDLNEKYKLRGGMWVIR